MTDSPWASLALDVTRHSDTTLYLPIVIPRTKYILYGGVSMTVSSAATQVLMNLIIGLLSSCYAEVVCTYLNIRLATTFIDPLCP